MLRFGKESGWFDRGSFDGGVVELLGNQRREVTGSREPKIFSLIVPQSQMERGEWNPDALLWASFGRPLDQRDPVAAPMSYQCGYIMWIYIVHENDLPRP